MWGKSRGHLIGQLHEFSIIQTNVQVHEKHQEEKEEGNYEAQTHSTRMSTLQGQDITAVATMSCRNGIIQ